MSERPDYPEGAFWLDKDVADWLVVIADRHFAGDRDMAMNEMLRVVMEIWKKPNDLWAGVHRHGNALLAGQRAQRLREISDRDRRSGSPGSA